ncbi:L-serine ammonia-lyase, iron-sulfur-dependent, subunit alpha [Mesoterricola sediminis]|uniref:L-serine dehydratase n=1 Tax=Mesoterricola sediminis TaxID=2927980 RepID=A0AA48H3H5_9BACT|nr:L-serine ammonia-lyase, iron-sulfur-dependent, subunit alpha [Mesoterricola sediminis]BDU76786.1 L-serine dehydratase, iron-sulfur-dependent subunit alpha [Mesoterricola sediminis]
MTLVAGTLSAYRAAALERDAPLWSVFLAEEAAQSGRDPSALEALMRERIRVMRQSAARGLGNPQMSRSGLIRGGAHRMAAWMDSGASLLGPAFTRLAATALAVAEVNACMGRIVAAPTAGACGVLPAALFTVADEKGRSEEELVRAFFTAGGVGLVIEHLASLSGAEGGCQAEVGSASAMAAGGLVELMGGTPLQVDHAVAFALSNVMGLICDPVQGLVEVPCVYRNAMGAANAVVSAEIALAGVESAFTADQVIETMGRVGRRIPEEFRETARGGLASLPAPGCDSCRGACGNA